jgi:hypothetical protein
MRRRTRGIMKNVLVSPMTPVRGGRKMKSLLLVIGVILLILASFTASGCAGSSVARDPEPAAAAPAANTPPSAAPVVHRPRITATTRNATHAFAPMSLAFKTLETAFPYLTTKRWYCYYEFADERRQSHYRCEYGNNGPLRVTVHITEDGNPLNYVTWGWRYASAHHNAANYYGGAANINDLPAVALVDVDSSYLVEEPSLDYSAVDEAEFCSTHDCIANFENGNGNIAQCSDGTWTHSGGIRGACSHHGGLADGPGSAGSIGTGYDPNNDGSPVNWCGASRDGDGDGLYCEGR